MQGLPGLKQFQNGGCLSYCFWDHSSRHAVIVDPNVELMEEVRAFLAESRLQLRFVFDTHTHADHFSASHILRKEYGAEIVMGDRTESARATIKLGHEDKIDIGPYAFKALRTPGHTPDSVIFYLDHPSVRLMFSGDTLLIGATGRTDFPGSNPAEQWDSLQNVIARLPGNTLVYPGHDYFGFLFSTIDHEKKNNAHWKVDSLHRFVEMKMREVSGVIRDEVRKRIEYNKTAFPTLGTDGLHRGAVIACGHGRDEPTSMATIGVEKLLAKLELRTVGAFLLDVRERTEFELGRMPGAVNIPLSELGFHLQRLGELSRIYASCLSGRRSALAVKTLQHLGFGDVVNVAGGFKAWQSAGYPVERGQETPPVTG